MDVVLVMTGQSKEKGELVPKRRKRLHPMPVTLCACIRRSLISEFFAIGVGQKVQKGMQASVSSGHGGLLLGTCETSQIWTSHRRETRVWCVSEGAASVITVI